MENELTTHFKMLDYYKNLLLNSETKEQQERLQEIIDCEKKREENLYIKKSYLKIN